MSEQDEVMRITRLGNPRKPTGAEGVQMLKRMNESHFSVTGWALEHWKVGASDQLLDIGCGGGATLRRLSEQISEGHLTGLDYSAVSVEVSKETNREDVTSGKMEIVQGDVACLPFSENHFDKIITVESFYFWPDPAENLKEVVRVLKKGGTFLLVADVYNKKDLPQQAIDNIREFGLFNPTGEEFEQLFRQAGFETVEIDTRPELNWICAKGIK